MKAKKIQVPVLLVFLFTFVSCVTVNIYFPAAKVEKAADEIVDEVYKDNSSQPQKPKPEPTSSLMRFLALLGPSAAHAADATEVSNASIRGLKDQIGNNHKQLLDFYNKGNVGINNRGYLEIKEEKGLNLKDLARLRQLVNADNNARKKLYEEVAKALKIKGDQLGKIEKIFAEKWRSKAGGGWLIQEDSGNWKKR